jgi:hypothetical protein
MIAEGHEICTGCGQEIDPDCCGCGSGLEDSEHGSWNYTHPFIPMGCDCYRVRAAPPPPAATPQLDDEP